MKEIYYNIIYLMLFKNLQKDYLKTNYVFR